MSHFFIDTMPVELPMNDLLQIWPKKLIYYLQLKIKYFTIFLYMHVVGEQKEPINDAAWKCIYIHTHGHGQCVLRIMRYAFLNTYTWKRALSVLGSWCTSVFLSVWVFVQLIMCAVMVRVSLYLCVYVSCLYVSILGVYVFTCVFVFLFVWVFLCVLVLIDDCMV